MFWEGEGLEFLSLRDGTEYLLRISTRALVGRLAGTSSAVGRGLGNIRSAGTQG